MRYARITILFTLFSAACDGGKQVDDILALEGDAENGALVWADNCAACHAADGTGGQGPDLVSLLVNNGAEEEHPDFTEMILGGEGDMPSFADTLTDQEIADILAWLDEQAAGA